MDDKARIRFIRNRLKAIYHSCHSSACFSRADTEEVSDDEIKKSGLMCKAQAYEEAAIWINAIIIKI